MPCPDYDAQYNIYWDCDVDNDCLQSDILNAIADAVEQYKDEAGSEYDVTITSACREFNGGSLHDDGLALDFRTIDLPGGGNGSMAQNIRDAIASDLGGDYDVILHCGTCWHIHIEYDPPV